ncbi:MAG: S8 family serine peptidase [Gemmatimonadaceae bacterium]
MNRVRSIAILGVIGLAACAEPPVSPIPSAAAHLVTRSIQGAGDGYVIIGKSEKLPSTLAADVAAAGGVLVSSHPDIGVAYAQSSSTNFRRSLSKHGAIESVTPDHVLEWVSPTAARESADVSAEVASIGDNEGLYPLQWAPAAVQAPEAWNAGYTGRGVRVAILDGGIHSAHIDLASNLDVAASKSFAEGAYNEDVGTFWHGTHVAGIVAAADNSFGTIGIAPNATLIGVKVLHNGSGAFSWIINGIMYAGTPQSEGGAGANIINMSLGAKLDDKDKETKADIRELKKAVDRAMKYAHQRGTTIIVSAGNGGLNYDDEKNLFKTPAQNDYAISVSATGPHGWALGASNFERPTYYTDHGKSLVTLAAPGGTDGLFVVDGVDQLCVVGGIQRFCEVFDMVFSTVRGGASSTGAYNWAYGTSMAAPMVSGIAALIIEKNGGRMHPEQVRTRLEQSALDLGKPGNDKYYGGGWVNALRAIQ